MNTTLTILLLIALLIAIICDIIRIRQYKRSIEESRKNIKETICKAVEKAVYDWLEDSDASDDISDINEYFRENFDKYLLRWNKYETRQPEIGKEVLLVSGVDTYLAWTEHNPFDKRIHWYCSDDIDFIPRPDDKWVYINEILKNIKD